MKTLAFVTLCPALAAADDPATNVRFAYTAEHNGQIGIYLHTSRNERWLTPFLPHSFAPSWSPDGAYILFYHNAPSPDGGSVTPQLSLLRMKDRSVTKVDIGSDEGGYFPAFAPIVQPE